MRKKMHRGFFIVIDRAPVWWLSAAFILLNMRGTSTARDAFMHQPIIERCPPALEQDNGASLRSRRRSFFSPCDRVLFGHGHCRFAAADRQLPSTGSALHDLTTRIQPAGSV